MSDTVLYPPPPAEVPRDLASATAQYRRHAWLAMFGLLIFALMYLALTGWFAWSAYRLLKLGFSTHGDFWKILMGLGSTFLAVFMLKGLFFRKGSTQSQEFEVTPEDQPRLFAFLYKLADDTNAPRPHKVFLSPHVNACVFYDLTLLNFFFPSRKNLEIGLGLVNVLSLSELKAVLAHEFGHFAQNTMAVGRWVYMAQQVATQLIFHRDALDSFLNFLSRIDLRIAWIGWILRLVVWSIRSVLDTALSGVMLAHRALSREMEFQADLVAVSATGSDALVHALYRLPAADEAWGQATSFIGKELDEGHATRDVFAIQTRILEHQRRILHDPDYGEVPDLPAEGRAGHRIFTADLAQPPQMWSTHPQNHLREENAKRTYVPNDFEDRSAWVIFNDPQGLRERLSSHLLAEFKKEVREPEETLAALDESYRKEYFNTEYRGAYLGRSVVAHAANVADLYGQGEPPAPADLYPESLTDEIERQRNLEKEEALLIALRDGHLEPPGGVIRFRGRVIKRTDLGEAIELVQADLRVCREGLENHDRMCRRYHYGLAQRFGGNWPLYHDHLLRTLHYAEHSLRNLSDAETLVGNTWAVITADGNISQNELTRLLADTADLHRVLTGIYRDRDQLVLAKPLLERLKLESWQAALEPCRLPPPTAENLGEWMQATGGWMEAALGALSALREAALEELLVVEKELARHTQTGDPLPPPPSPGAVPAQYPVLLPGQERKLQTKLNWWDSFQTASGVVPATLRLAVSLAIVVGAVWLTVPQ